MQCARFYGFGPTAAISPPLSVTTTRINLNRIKGNSSFGVNNGVEGTLNAEDNVSPVINEVSASPDTLWPPDHKMRAATVTVDVSDANPTCPIVSVSNNEPDNDKGDGNTSPDWTITGAPTADLRAERSGGGAGRVYTITVECTDSSGNFSTSTVTVSVPHD